MNSFEKACSRLGGIMGVCIAVGYTKGDICLMGLGLAMVLFGVALLSRIPDQNWGNQ